MFKNPLATLQGRQYAAMKTVVAKNLVDALYPELSKRENIVGKTQLAQAFFLIGDVTENQNTSSWFLDFGMALVGSAQDEIFDVVKNSENLDILNLIGVKEGLTIKEARDAAAEDALIRYSIQKENAVVVPSEDVVAPPAEQKEQPVVKQDEPAVEIANDNAVVNENIAKIISMPDKTQPKKEGGCGRCGKTGYKKSTAQTYSVEHMSKFDNEELKTLGGVEICGKCKLEVQELMKALNNLKPLQEKLTTKEEEYLQAGARVDQLNSDIEKIAAAVETAADVAKPILEGKLEEMRLSVQKEQTLCVALDKEMGTLNTRIEAINKKLA